MTETKKTNEPTEANETFSAMLGAAYAAAKALRDVPETRISLGAGLTEEQVEAFADAFEVKVARQVSTVLGAPRLIYSFSGKYEAALSGGKHDVEVHGQGSRPATVDEAREHGVRIHPDVRTVTGDEAAAQVR